MGSNSVLEFNSAPQSEYVERTGEKTYLKGLERYLQGQLDDAAQRDVDDSDDTHVIGGGLG